MRSALWLLLALPVLAADPARKSVFIITDGEGVAGICRQDQTETTHPELRQLLTGEVNAAVQGFLDGGVDEVVVWDGHSNSSTLSATTIHPRAKLMQGGAGMTMTLTRKYSAVAFVGQHSKAGVAKGIMAHSYSSLGIQNLRMNGAAVGETETRTALAGWFDTPVILLTGDQTAAAEMTALVPDAEVAIVKEGLARYTCISLSASAAQAAIHDAAKRAAQKISAIKPYKITGPVTIEIEYTTRNSLRPDNEEARGGEVVDDRTVRFHGANFLDAWKKAHLW